jgi:hypothetical protein
MPLIHHNLQSLQDSFVQRLQGHRRNVWLRNNCIMGKLKGIVQAFDAKGIDHMMLKGAPLGIHYYKDMGVRPMGDGDIMVRHAQRDMALDIITSPPFNCFFVAGKNRQKAYSNHSADLKTDDHLAIDLHWNLFSEHANVAHVDDRIWEKRQAFSFMGVKSFMLNPSHQFFHIVAHGRTYSPVPPFRWIADAFVIYKNTSIDWDEVADLAIAYKYTPFFAKALPFLQETFGMVIPESCIARIQRHPVSAFHHKYYQIATSPTLLKSRNVQSLPDLWRWMQFNYYGHTVYRKGSFIKWAIARLNLKLHRDV